ncbi:uncharacterized protein CELE_F14F8.14 [Caenorhabditis elegans]|uniref:Uncharacterized protein n=1 Tax=Caenorhabditis elegans TaxID=6239 RepID=Q564R9_CAEEL|nr:Uncharacterized protein CELE_F14F8.14 [Caenorhabditis elegans]CAI79170.1 Uncharacterized protein CELE_F14F8.14 [Caenorhabditis elegans]|eukprot:NP_001023802.1 Uncharacterized protein CELE_F14F8.14 [Caenorhabditis elegans]
MSCRRPFGLLNPGSDQDSERITTIIAREETLQLEEAHDIAMEQEADEEVADEGEDTDVEDDEEQEED